jgi:aminopeptidase-like protein
MNKFESQVKLFWMSVKDLHLGVSQQDNLRLMSAIREIYGELDVFSFPSGSILQGWEIAPEWLIDRATIKDRDGSQTVLDRRFGVPYLMESSFFEISDKNDKRIFTSSLDNEGVPWHCSAQYRPWIKPVGICLSKKVLDELTFPISVDVSTITNPGDMHVAEMSTGSGRQNNTVFLNAHTCHPGQFNDALIGIATIASLIEFLRTKKTKLKYNYRGIFAPEHIGTVFYLDMLKKQAFNFEPNSHLSIYTEMTALNNPISLQESLLGDSILDRLLKYLLLSRKVSRIGPFRSIVGNDETVWESVGYEIPCVSISRVSSRNYYSSYHTNLDSLDRADLGAAGEVYSLLIECIEILEVDVIPIFTESGLHCLSNPLYDLYTPWPDPTLDKDFSEVAESKFAKIQDVLPRFMKGQFSCAELSVALNVPFHQMFSYLEKWRNKGLLKFSEIESLEFYSTEKISELDKLIRIVN